jgi:hypothetical protein
MRGDAEEELPPAARKILSTLQKGPLDRIQIHDITGYPKGTISKMLERLIRLDRVQVDAGIRRKRKVRVTYRLDADYLKIFGQRPDYRILRIFLWCSPRGTTADPLQHRRRPAPPLSLQMISAALKRHSKEVCERNILRGYIDKLVNEDLLEVIDSEKKGKKSYDLSWRGVRVALTAAAYLKEPVPLRDVAHNYGRHMPLTLGKWDRFIATGTEPVAERHLLNNVFLQTNFVEFNPLDRDFEISETEILSQFLFPIPRQLTNDYRLPASLSYASDYPAEWLGEWYEKWKEAISGDPDLLPAATKLARLRADRYSGLQRSWETLANDLDYELLEMNERGQINAKTWFAAGDSGEHTFDGSFPFTKLPSRNLATRK